MQIIDDKVPKRQIYLSDTEVKICKSLGLTTREYAMQLIKAGRQDECRICEQVDCQCK